MYENDNISIPTKWILTELWQNTQVSDIRPIWASCSSNRLRVKRNQSSVISTSVISNNRLSRRKNPVLVITQKSKIRL